MQMQAGQLWQAVLGDMQTRLPRNAFENWLRPTILIAFENDVATVAAPNLYSADTLKNRYADQIERLLTEFVGRPVRVEFTVPSGVDTDDAATDLGAFAPSIPQLPDRKTDRTVSKGRGRGRAQRDQQNELQLPLAPATPLPPAAHNLNPRYVFETYVVGKSNVFAHAAAQAVAEHPGEQYNPLYIHGGVGLGKTHLLHAIGHKAISIRPNLRVVYVSSEKFTNDLIEAIRSQRMDEFRARYRTIDLLMIDDIQFIGGKDSTQEEFFHTFNTLYQGSKQLVISSDRQPSQIAGLEDRLRSRFEGGLTADVQSPDFEMRIAILREKADEMGVKLDDEVIEYIAHRDKTNIRELEGAFNKVLAVERLQGRAITLQSAIDTLSGGRAAARKADITNDDVIATVAEKCGVTVEAMKGRNRAQEIVMPRQIAMYLMREETGASLAEIGRALGGRDHTTVIHGIEKIEARLQEDAALRTRVIAIREALLTVP
ncbi:MAG: chromosomal replication initiator protein DnaA [Thermomicrobiales bacterium]|nr:chromosomal replication initiator protein DnaA [Thermomicrobiales bacterium]